MKFRRGRTRAILKRAFEWHSKSVTRISRKMLHMFFICLHIVTYAKDNSKVLRWLCVIYSNKMENEGVPITRLLSRASLSLD